MSFERWEAFIEQEKERKAERERRGKENGMKEVTGSKKKTRVIYISDMEPKRAQAKRDALFYGVMMSRKKRGRKK